MSNSVTQFYNSASTWARLITTYTSNIFLFMNIKRFVELYFHIYYKFLFFVVVQRCPYRILTSVTRSAFLAITWSLAAGNYVTRDRKASNVKGEVVSSVRNLYSWIRSLRNSKWHGGKTNGGYFTQIRFVNLAREKVLPPLTVSLASYDDTSNRIDFFYFCAKERRLFSRSHLSSMLARSILSVLKERNMYF